MTWVLMNSVTRLPIRAFTDRGEADAIRALIANDPELFLFAVPTGLVLG